jgi:hypothetical protein
MLESSMSGMIEPGITKNPRLARYLIDNGFEKVSGWLNSGAALATFLLSDWQVRAGITGHVAEIGVHHGKYFILLALLRQPSEMAVAIDVFGDQALNVDSSGLGDYDIFVANISRHVGGSQDVLVHQSDSLMLHGRDLLAPGLPPRLAESGQGFRIFSVDGCHTAKHTASDIAVAFDVLAPGGIVVVDDFYNAHWPGVQEGVHRLMAQRPDIAMFAYGNNKAFLTRAADHERYHTLFAREFTGFCSDYKAVEVHDRPCACFSMRSASGFFSSRLERLPGLMTSFGRTGGAIVELANGWAERREEDGTWMVEPTAEATIRLPRALLSAQTGEAILTLQAAPFLHPQRLTRRLVIRTEAGTVFDGRLLGTTEITIRVPTTMLEQSLHLFFESEEPEAPSDILKDSRDTRPLSVKMKQVAIAFDHAA